MRLHKNLVFATVDAVSEIFNEQVYADKVVAKVLKRDKRWGAKDRAFIAQTTYDIVRWMRLYAEIAEIKDHYTRENLYKVFAVWLVLKGIPIPDWKQFEGTPTRKIKGRFDTYSKQRVLRESIPDWMDALAVAELGEAFWTKEIQSQNQTAPVVLRVNTLKASVSQVKEALAKEDIYTKTIKNYPEALELLERAAVFRTEAFKKGFFEVQDASSQTVAHLLDIQPGMRIVDTCAGAGGKTLHLAALSKNKGQIIAMDIRSNKLNDLKKRARRAGAFNIETRQISGTKDIKKLYQKADRVLIDAPCSGLGVLRRNPDAKWKLKPEFIENIKQTQLQILKSYSKMLKSGGKLVYATCSILPSENEEQLKAFLETEEGKDFEFIKHDKIFAHQSGYDGFYRALLEKK